MPVLHPARPGDHYQAVTTDGQAAVPVGGTETRNVNVQARFLYGAIGAGLQTLFGGNITLYTELCEKARIDAYEQMLDHARVSGANAVIGMRYDANEIGQGITEVLAYGTAVTVE